MTIGLRNVDAVLGSVDVVNEVPSRREQCGEDQDARPAEQGGG